MARVPFPEAERLRGNPELDKDIRDPVHGDIALREHEQHIVNTPVFQRLHGIRQLGFAYHVYPGASHNRFQHSLGTAHMAQRIVEALTSPSAVAVPLARPDEDDEARLRVAALLHDIGHIPFGHTLEDEVKVFEERHSSPTRVAAMLTQLHSELNCAVCHRLIADAERILRTAELTEDEYRRAAERRKEGRPSALDECLEPERWYLADIIGNTICADLLDYILRDGYACGVATGFDHKLFRYFTTAHDRTRRTRLALALVKKDKFRIDIVSEIINVLRLRYTLSERVYHHHAKMAAGAMLGRAIQLSRLAPASFYGADDGRSLEVVEAEGARLERDGPGDTERQDGATIRELVGDLRTRRLHKAAYRLTTSALEIFVRVHTHTVSEMFGSPAQRAELEQEVLAAAGLPPGSVIVSCPSEEMALKATRVMVLWKGRSRRRRPGSNQVAERLRDIDERYFNRTLLNEVRSLENKYRGLWSLTVFVRAEHYNRAVLPVQRFLRERLQIPNDPLLAATIRDQEALEHDIEVRASVATQADALQEDVLSRFTQMQERQVAARTRGAGGSDAAIRDDAQLLEQAWQDALAARSQRLPEPDAPTPRPTARNMRLGEPAGGDGTA